MHFFSPVEKMPLLEVIVTPRTASWATVTAVDVGRRLGKTVVVVQDRPGFWVNRILAPYLSEAGRLVQEGVPIERVDAVMRQYGFPVGPITLLDQVGLDVALKAAQVLVDAFGDRMRPLSTLESLVAGGRLGRKSGLGFYRYQDGRRRSVDPAVYGALGVRAGSAPPEADVERRLTYAMLNEAARGVDELVVRSPRDGDIAAVFGIGFPAFRGGPLRTLDRTGAARAVDDLEHLARIYGDRFAPAPALQRLAGSGGRFYPEP
jgi:3-hydroxyacyl-CoA dehydrogenase/enoyl-CoA hydratase/3-hydroxybutyryl-CoA epimerase